MTLGEKAKEYYLNEGTNCAVSILLAANEIYKLGLDKEDAKLVTCFGGGVGCGNFCGALAGAEAVLAKVFLPQGVMYNMEFKDVTANFLKKFEEKWSSTLCAPIKEANSTAQERCALTVIETGDMLEEYIRGLKK